MMQRWRLVVMVMVGACATRSNPQPIVWAGPVDVLTSQDEALYVAGPQRIAKLDRQSQTIGWTVGTNTVFRADDDFEMYGLDGVTIAGDALVIWRRDEVVVLAESNGLLRGRWLLPGSMPQLEGLCVADTDLLLGYSTGNTDPMPSEDGEIVYEVVDRYDLKTTEKGIGTMTCAPVPVGQPHYLPGQKWESDWVEVGQEARATTEVLVDGHRYRFVDRRRTEGAMVERVGKWVVVRPQGMSPKFFGVVEGVVIVGARSETIGLDAITGQVRWSAPGFGTGFDTVLQGKAMYYASEEGLVALDVTTGGQLPAVPPPPKR